MKYLYFGTICNQKNYLQLLDSFRIKPSIAPFIFESALLRGFQENQAELEVLSFPVIPAFPKSKHLGWGTRKETLSSGYSCTWLGAINIAGIKQLTQRISSHIALKKWLKENAGIEKAVLIYSAYQPVAKSIVTLCKKYHTKCFAIIPDLPRDMYNVSKIHPVKKFLSTFYVNAAVKTQGLFDGYIYLTEHMKDAINSVAPYAVVEGIADISEAKKLQESNKSPHPVIMYAGTLSAKYGLKNLVEAFHTAEIKNAELWLFGSGDFQSELQQYATKDSRIKYWGRVSRNEILEYEKKATLLVNVRDNRDTFTKYSFPSKVIEYMLSGTPMFMTKLSGIPDEYYQYVYSVEDNSVPTLKSALEEICTKNTDELLSFGECARQFIIENKNSKAQARKIIDFIASL